MVLSLKIRKIFAAASDPNGLNRMLNVINDRCPINSVMTPVLSLAKKIKNARNIRNSALCRLLSARTKKIIN